MQGNRSGRKPWIDLLRGFALVLVICGHQGAAGYPFGLLTNPVKIPLFFAITGLVFNEKRDFRSFIGVVLRRLVLPWLALGILGCAAEAALNGLSSFPRRALGLLAGVSAWYMPCCIVAEVLWFCIRRYARSLPATACAAAACFAAGYILCQRGILDFMMINRALTAQAFLLIGLLYRRHGERLRQAGWAGIAVGAAVYAVLALVSRHWFPGKTLDVHLCRYYSLPVCLAMCAAGCWTLFALCERCVKGLPRPVAAFGQNTLVIYMLHNFTTRLPVHLLGAAGLGKSLPLVLAAVAACCGIYGAAAWAIGRYLPLLAGKKRK